MAANNDAPDSITLRDPDPKAEGRMGRKLIYLLVGVLFLFVFMIRCAVKHMNSRGEQQSIRQAQKSVAHGPAINILKDTGMDGPKASPVVATVTPEPVDQTRFADPSAPPGSSTQPIINNLSPFKNPATGAVAPTPEFTAPQIEVTQQQEDPEEKAEIEFEIRRRGDTSSQNLPQTIAQNIPAPVPPVSPIVAPQAGYAPPAGVSAIDETPTNTEKAKLNQQAFRRGGKEKQDNYLEAEREMPRSKFEVQASTSIPITLDGNAESSLPGEISAHVRENVYDSLSGKYIMIPTGSRLIGEYNSDVGYGQSRLQVVWTRLIFPDTSFIDLGRMSGYAPDGSNGFHDKTNSHWKKVFATALITSALTAGFQISQNRGQQTTYGYPSTGQVAASAVGMEGNRVSDQIVARAANQQPTILIRAGYPGSVRVNKDIVLDGPYEDLVK